MKRVSLEVFNLASTIRLDASREFMLSPIALQKVVDARVGAVILQFRARVAGERLKREEVRYPADWWQAFKDRWFPMWAKRRWPVRHSVVVLEARGLYPMMALPDRPDAHIDVLVDRQPDTWGAR
jgi:hypothetical protein